MRKRGRGEGTISQRADGRWQVRVALGRGDDGQRRRKCAYAATQAEAVHLLKTLGGRSADGLLLTTSTPTVGQFLDDWFATNTDVWRPSTQRTYRGAIDLYLKPAFGHLRLERLTPLLVQRWLTQQTPQVRRRHLLASRPARAESQAPDHLAGRVAGARSTSK